MGTHFFFLTYQNKLTLLLLDHIQECPFHLCQTIGVNRFPLVIMQSKLKKKFHFANRICFTSCPPQTPASSFFRLFSPKSLRFVSLQGMWNSWHLKVQPFLTSHSWALSVTKNSSIYFESGNNIISLPACMHNSKMPETILLKLSTHSPLGWD